MTQRSSPVLNLTLLIALGWVICFWPARATGGQERVVWMTVAAVACLVTGWLVSLSTLLTRTVGPDKLAFVHMAIRVVIVVAIVLVVKWLKPNFGFVDFYGWLFGFYLLGMAIEVASLRRQLEHTDASVSDSSRHQ